MMTSAEAEIAGHKLATSLGDGWTVRVRRLMLGKWTFFVESGPLEVHPKENNYFAVIVELFPDNPNSTFRPSLWASDEFVNPLAAIEDVIQKGQEAVDNDTSILEGAKKLLKTLKSD